ncbi:SoxR reducing system RseC family protein [Shewanella litorisediminis]|uniref:SoxR reducing system RseC family protein n=1 Tax=Shewanella litorisediminis TaxID=1173586 RepID=A0ABX7G5S4_9GAMM|nr:SoxR reducing system RseC family protein [Shewanella litorisediminis]MCL2917494.1 SoxR reducing system RseC family protein [Shewanella litorisediminis]QRH02623.1 SoxR reducing system RseC family protein [Shewanella litorisediminis]
MMEELARVVRVESSGWVTVEVEVKTACGHCAASESCGTGAIASAFAGKTQQFSIKSTEAFEEGELIRLGLPESALLKAAALVYLLPLVGLLLGAFGGKMAGSALSFGSETASLVFSLLGAIVAWLWGKRLAKNLERQTQPVILARLGKAVEPSCLTKAV